MCDCLRIKFFWYIFHKEQTVPFYKSMVKAAFYLGHMYDAFTTLYIRLHYVGLPIKTSFKLYFVTDLI